MHPSQVTTEGVVVTPLSLEDGSKGLFAHFKAVFNEIDECDCLAFGRLGIEVIGTLKERDKILVRGALYCGSSNSRSLCIFEIDKH